MCLCVQVFLTTKRHSQICWHSRFEEEDVAAVLQTDARNIRAKGPHLLCVLNVIHQVLSKDLFKSRQCALEVVVKQ